MKKKSPKRDRRLESRSESVMLQPGLSRREAAKQTAKKRKLRHDHRGFHYDPQTGRATYT